MQAPASGTSGTRAVRAIVAWWPALLLAVAAVWVTSPMYDVAWWISDERDFYPMRVHQYLEAWQAGAWYPRWCPDFYGGYGYPFLHYYAPGVYATAAAVSELLATGPLLALKVVITTVSAASAVGMYGWLRTETKRTDAALLGAACFVFLPYRHVDLFERGDLAEYSAYCLLPFVAWSYRSLASATGKRAALAACAAALTHAGVLLTHTLMGLFTTELAGLYIVGLLARRQRRAACLAGATLGFAIALAAVYWVPALLERDLVLLERITKHRFTPWQNAIPLESLFGSLFTPGWPFFVGLGGWLISFAAPWTRRAATRAAAPWLIASALMALMLPKVVDIWKIVPFGAEVQFPWRLLGLVGVFMALGLALWWAELIRSTKLALAAAVLLCLPLPGLLGAPRHVEPAGHIPLTTEEIRAGMHRTAVMDEYRPRHVKAPPQEPRSRLAWPTQSGTRVLARELDGLHYELEIDAPTPTEVTLAVFGFRGWHVRTLDGPAPAHLDHRAGDGLLRVALPEAGRYRALVFFGHTPMRLAATVTSLLALVALFPALWLLARRLAKP